MRLDDISVCPKRVDIQLTQEDLNFITEFANNVAKRKMEEGHIQADSGELIKRQITGKVGELAVERWLKTPFLDTTIGASKDYAVPDLRIAGYEMGCKTVEIGKAPLVPKKPKVPELIMLWNPKTYMVHILGIATPKLIMEHGDDSLVLSPNVRRLGWKTGFGAFDKLLPPTGFWLNQFQA